MIILRFLFYSLFSIFVLANTSAQTCIIKYDVFGCVSCSGYGAYIEELKEMMPTRFVLPDRYKEFGGEFLSEIYDFEIVEDDIIYSDSLFNSKSYDGRSGFFIRDKENKIVKSFLTIDLSPLLIEELRKEFGSAKINFSEVLSIKNVISERTRFTSNILMGALFDEATLKFYVLDYSSKSTAIYDFNKLNRDSLRKIILGRDFESRVDTAFDNMLKRTNQFDLISISTVILNDTIVTIMYGMFGDIGKYIVLNGGNDSVPAVGNEFYFFYFDAQGKMLKMVPLDFEERPDHSTNVYNAFVFKNKVNFLGNRQDKYNELTYRAVRNKSSKLFELAPPVYLGSIRDSTYADRFITCESLVRGKYLLTFSPKYLIDLVSNKSINLDPNSQLSLDSLSVVDFIPSLDNSRVKFLAYKDNKSFRFFEFDTKTGKVLSNTPILFHMTYGNATNIRFYDYDNLIYLDAKKRVVLKSTYTDFLTNTGN